MVNSWGNFPPTGLFEGSLTDFGSYDQCLSIPDNDLIGSAQYCSISFLPVIPRPMPKQQNLYHIIPNLLANNVSTNKTNALNKIAVEASIFYWVSLRTAICTPNKCSQNDILLLSKTISVKFGLELKSVKCEIKSKVFVTHIQLSAIALILVFLLLCILATICDSNFEFKKNSKGFIFVRLFAINHSVNRLVAPTTSKDLACIHGIRVLTIVWILYGHTIQWSNFQLYARSFRGKELLTAFIAQPFLNGEYGVVTFLQISGILTSYITLSVTKGNPKNFSVLLYITLRAARLLPQLLIFILLTFLLPLLGSGPIWNEVIGTNIKNCANNWWLNVFLIHNLYKSDQMCALHTWFIALDFQYHIMTALLIVVFLYNLKFGVYLNVITILTFMAISSVMYYIYELPPALINTGRTEYFERYYSFLYHKVPVSYGAVYFIGTLFGYAIYRKMSINIRKPLLTVVWVAIMITYCIPLWDKVYWNYGQPYAPLVSTLSYNSCQLIWTVCTSMMIWLCISGKGGILNKFLSHKVFIPLARLTYSVYLCHAWLIWYYIGSRRHLTDTNMYDLFINFIHIAVMAYIIGFGFFVLFESPILELQKYFIETMRRKYENRDQRGVELNKLNAK